MKKFLVVVKREYSQRVRTRMFLATTILGPLIISLFAVVPMLIFQIKAGGPIRLAVVDQTGKLYSSFASAVNETEPDTDAELDQMNVNGNTEERMRGAAELASPNFFLEEVNTAARSIDEIKSELNARLRAKELDGYVVLPADVLQSGAAEFYGRNVGDVFTTEHVERAITDAVREERLSAANIDVKTVRALSQPVLLHSIKVGAEAETADAGEGFVLVFAVGFVTYLTILMYGQIILGAVIEEKETRIAEILFSSVKPTTIMLGKLIGVSLVALTQLAIWGSAFLLFTLLGAGFLAGRETSVTIPGIAPVVYLYFALFFLLGYFIYATMYALVGSMVTTAQEGGQLAMPIVLLLVVAFYLAFPILRSPDSNFAVIASLVPFFAPITMLVRIVTQTPPFWQVLLSLIIGFTTVFLLTWVAGRIYRTGMLMYGKKATIPEAWRWLRRA